jgi:hypothetical protein
MRRINLYITAVLVLILVVYLLFLDTLAKPVFEQLATEQYGAEVSIDRVRLQPFVGKATLFNLQVADRRDAMQNLVQADRVYVDIDMFKLAESVIDVSEMQIDGLLSFAPRETAATILRPLVKEDSGLASIGLPDFEIPDVDRLVDQKRDELVAEIDTLQQTFEDTEAKWKQKIDSIPGDKEVKAWKQRVRKLKKPDDPLQALNAVTELQTIYKEIDSETQRLRNFQKEFRGDMKMLQEQVNLATNLPQKYTNSLVRSLGLSSDQMAQLGHQLMRGDLDGLLQQVLAPLAFNTSGEASTQEDAMPIFIRHAIINGPLLPSAAGLSVEGELRDFAWPLEKADNVASLLLNGSTLDGGSLSVDALVDHRSTPVDRVSVNIADLPLKEMSLAGSEQLGIELLQTLASVTGELSVKDGELGGAFTNQFTKTVFETTLGENAGSAAQIIARMLEASNEFLMRVGFSGTLENPQVSFSSDMDQLIQSTIESAISESVTKLTNDLQLQLSREVGPELASARQQFSALENLQAELQKNLRELNQISK